MYQLNSKSICDESSRHDPHGGLLPVLLVPGSLILLCMKLALRLPGEEAEWRRELRRQSGSEFFRSVYAAMIWFMVFAFIGVFCAA